MKKEKRVPLPVRIKESLKRDIDAVAEKENVNPTDVAEAWLLVGQKEYRKHDK